MKSIYKFFLAFVVLAVTCISCSDKEDTPTVVDVYTIDSNIVETKEINDVSVNTVLAGAIIKGETKGITSKGICFSTSKNPRIEKDDTKLYTGDLSNFNISILDLKENTTYYARAFVKKSSSTYYGNEVEFTTKTFKKIYTDGLGVTDVDGNVYKTVIIGTQEWMAENLRVGKFNNAEEITEGTWKHDTEVNDKVYGRYYNWNVASSAKMICPKGWRLPKMSDWDILIKEVDPIFFETKNMAAIKLKSNGFVENSTGFWRKSDSSIGGTNESGFNALPSATYNFTESDLYLGIGYEAIYWTADAKDTDNANTIYISNYSNQVEKQFANKKSIGLSCRCIKE